MAADITASLRQLDAEDPVRFDFSLCHLGMRNACGFGRRRGRCSMPAQGTRAGRAHACDCLRARDGDGLHGSRRIERYPALEWSDDRSHVAFSRDRLCEKAPCESLYLGATVETAAALEGLADGQESCDEIAWTRTANGSRFSSTAAS